MSGKKEERAEKEQAEKGGLTKRLGPSEEEIIVKL